jgi:hypothetical protein
VPVLTLLIDHHTDLGDTGILWMRDATYVFFQRFFDLSLLTVKRQAVEKQRLFLSIRGPRRLGVRHDDHLAIDFLEPEVLDRLLGFCLVREVDVGVALGVACAVPENSDV